MSSEKWLYDPNKPEPWVSISGKVPPGATEIDPKPDESWTFDGTNWQPPDAQTALAIMVERASAVVQRHVDDTARQKRYADGVHCASYAMCPVYGVEATAFLAWRGAVWQAMDTLEQEVAAGQAQPPETEEALLALLPVMVWPDE